MALTPMMRQYLDIKEENKDCILFFRLGDFYEMFFEDAVLASKELDIALTGKDCGLEERAPMCGVPFHAVDGYIKKLVDKGYKVAICEQLEDPELAKGLVQRGITRVVTPGTLTDPGMLTDTENNYIFAIYEQMYALGVAYADVSTGAFYVEEAASFQELQNLLSRVKPKEVLFQKSNQLVKEFLDLKKGEYFLSAYEDWPFTPQNALKTVLSHFKLLGVESFGINKNSLCVNATGALLQYLLETQKNSLAHIKKISMTSGGKYMVVDHFTLRNLELLENIRDKSRKGTLLWLLDKTKTAMGGRLIKRYIEQPLLVKSEINLRLACVDEFKNDIYLRSEVRKHLAEIYDIERLITKISYGTLNGRDALALRSSIASLGKVKNILENGTKAKLLIQAGEGLSLFPELLEILSKGIADEPPISVKEGGLIKMGYDPEVDKLRAAKQNGQKWLSDLERKEREETGIKNLKISFNKVFGYYIEVTKSNLGLVPTYRYVRKQTLAGSERYITPELKDLEETLLSSEYKCAKKEYQVFESIRTHIEEKIEELQKNADMIALVDVLQSFAQAAYDYDFVKPQMSEDGEIDIKGGRHPVVERAVSQEFVPNDVFMDGGDNKLLIITGPNMAGKSTFMRQTALIVLMAQIGSFVPAVSAKISVTDRIFTRVGASDDLSSGQSTFMVEMNELASILNNATSKSLLILDEIGRGTSTIDGLSIAWATVEYILDQQNGLGGKTLFATHYHELIGLENVLPGIKNYSVTVKEYNRTVIFMHKIKKGGADKSFGVEVAKLAGLPEKLTERAKALVTVLEQNGGKGIAELDRENLLSEMPQTEAKENVNAEKLISALKNIDINLLTPLEALSILNEMKQKV